MCLPKTLNVQIGKKLRDQLKEDIRKEVFKAFNLFGVVAIQVAYEVIRVTFSTDDSFRQAKELTGVRLFGLWCPILGGGPPVTIVHVFDYPFEEENDHVSFVFGNFGEVKKVKNQTYLSNNNIFTGTRLVFMVLNSTLPRSLTVNGYSCRVWYRGQPLVCNLCNVQGHKSAVCPNKDKCRQCGEQGHFARSCSKRLNPPSEVSLSAFPALPSEGADVGLGEGTSAHAENSAGADGADGAVAPHAPSDRPEPATGSGDVGENSEVTVVENAFDSTEAEVTADACAIPNSSVSDSVILEILESSVPSAVTRPSDVSVESVPSDKVHPSGGTKAVEYKHDIVSTVVVARELSGSPVESGDIVKWSEGNSIMEFSENSENQSILAAMDLPPPEYRSRSLLGKAKSSMILKLLPQKKARGGYHALPSVAASKLAGLKSKKYGFLPNL